MKRIIRLFFTSLLVAIVAITGVVHAEVSADYLAVVHDRCDELKSTLDTQRKHDLVIRINRGRSYQTIIDQQQSFTQRLHNNKLNADEFTQQSSDIEARVESFRTAYNRYDDAMGALLAIDCRANAQEFVAQLQAARVLRAVIGAEVASINNGLTHYRETVVEFQKTVPEAKP